MIFFHFLVIQTHKHQRFAKYPESENEWEFFWHDLFWFGIDQSWSCLEAFKMGLFSVNLCWHCSISFYTRFLPFPFLVTMKNMQLKDPTSLHLSYTTLFQNPTFFNKLPPQRPPHFQIHFESWIKTPFQKHKVSNNLNKAHIKGKSKERVTGLGEIKPL